MVYVVRFLSVVLFVVALALPVLAGPAETVDQFHDALTSGDEETALGLLGQDLIVFEGGESEMSLEEYASHHLGSDMKFSAKAKRKLARREVFDAGDAQWVLSIYEIRARVRGTPATYRNTETMVLRGNGDDLRIVHIHWSNKKVK